MDAGEIMVVLGLCLAVAFLVLLSWFRVPCVAFLCLPLCLCVLVLVS